MKILIEVKGGSVQSICTNGKAEIYLVDHDNLDAGDVVKDAKEAIFPDAIAADDAEFDNWITEALEEHEEKEF